MKGYADNFPYRLDDMQLDDVDEVMAIENRSFSSPWSARAYRYEITNNNFSQFIVARQSQTAQEPRDQHVGAFRQLLGVYVRSRLARPAVLGYAGLWLLIDEAHISTIAVMPEWRGHKLGEFLLIGLLERAIAMRAEIATLEVRISNQVAQNLYRKYQFQAVGMRRNYYHDNLEDALVMSTPPLHSPIFRDALSQNKAVLFDVLSDNGHRPRRAGAISQMG